MWMLKLLVKLRLFFLMLLTLLMHAFFKIFSILIVGILIGASHYAMQKVIYFESFFILLEVIILFFIFKKTTWIKSVRELLLLYFFSALIIILLMILGYMPMLGEA